MGYRPWGCKKLDMTEQLSTGTSYGSSKYSTSEYLFKESKNTNLNRYMHPYINYSVVCYCEDM